MVSRLKNLKAEKISKDLKKVYEEGDWPSIAAMARSPGIPESSFRDYFYGRAYPGRENLNKINKITKEGSLEKKLDLEDLPSNPPVDNKTIDNICSESDNEKFSEMIIVNEFVRDPIWGDVSITVLERKIIDNEVFQRLRKISQLGPTSVVYPGATHTRFSHSIGILSATEKIIDICNKNAENCARLEIKLKSKYGNDAPLAMKIENREHFLVRLYALIHDVAHVPFGHTFEDEGELFDAEWKDRERIKLYFDNNIKKIIENEMKNKGFSVICIGGIIEELRHLLTCTSKEHMQLPRPYIYEIVSNTVCADLLDYSVRDMQYAGLVERWGDRFLRYMTILPLTQIEEDEDHFKVSTEKNAKGVVVLQAYRFEESPDGGDIKSTTKENILTEAIDLLRKRYSLAEKVYFHRTKIAASATLISAVNSSKLHKELFNIGDQELIDRLKEDTDIRVRNLVKSYEERNIYKPIYLIKFTVEKELDEKSRKLWGPNGVYDRFRDKEKRLKWEKTIEEEVNLLNGSDGNKYHGSVTIYCPDKDMNLKQFEMMVQTEPKGQIKPLSSFLDPLKQKEMGVINELYQHLWQFQVFVDPKKINPQEVGDTIVRYVAGRCESDGFSGDIPNDIEPLRGCRADFERTMFEMVLPEVEKETGKQILSLENLLKGETRPDLKTREDYKKYLKNKVERL